MTRVFVSLPEVDKQLLIQLRCELGLEPLSAREGPGELALAALQHTRTAL